MSRTPTSREEKLNMLYEEITTLERRLEKLENLNPAPKRDTVIESVKLSIAEKKAEVVRLEEDM